VLAAKLIEKHLPPVADPDLVMNAVAGDPKAFTELYLRYVKRISSLVGRMLRGSSEREDVTQEVFLQVHLSLPRFEGRSSFYTWIFRLAKNVTLHHLRASRHHYLLTRLDDAMEARLTRPSWVAGTSPERDADFNALFVETTRVIDQLIPNLREVMILGPVQGRTCEQIAGLLQVKTEVIKSRLHRARASARDAMWRADQRGTPHIETPTKPLIVVQPIVLP
jgi:RNA polymerase sigma-70 factor (ECF subfamily)